MNILFIYPDLNIDINWRGLYHEGIASLSAVLKAKGHSVKLIHVYNLKHSEDVFNTALDDIDLIAFSATTPMFPFVKQCSKRLKERYSDIPILCGGPHATSAPVETLKYSHVDYACVGEGEDFILDFLDYIKGSKKKEEVKNLVYRDNFGEIVINSVRAPIEALDRIPFPDREIFNSQHLESDSVFISGGRGCPYRCAYCANNHFNEIYKNRYFRLRKPESVIREIEMVLKKYPHINTILFSDDVFTMDRSWLSDFCALYVKTIGLPFKALAHPATITDAKIRLLKESGCIGMRFGIQSGNEFVRNKIMLRNVSDEKIRESIRILRKYNMDFAVDVIFGVPGETKSNMLDTIKMCAENELNMKSHIFYPLPSTELERVAIASGLLDKNTYGEDYHSKTILKYSNIHKMTILFFHRYSNALARIYNMTWRLRDKPLAKKMVFFILDNILCGDAMICCVITMRAAFIAARSVIRKILGIEEHRLEKLGM